MFNEESIAISHFIDYLKFPTVHPNPNYGAAIKFLLNYAAELNLQTQVVELHEGKPILVATWPGLSNTGSIMLNSHIDVVPVDEAKWTYPPFEGTRVDGKIYGRGAQDIKVLGVIYFEAIRRLKTTGFKPERTIHVTFVPDEEIGGHLGMELFVKSKEFAALNVAFALDEGNPSHTDELSVFYAERSPWWIKVHCKGTPGHGSRMRDDTAGEKLWRLTDKLMRFRQAQRAVLNVSKQTTWQNEGQLGNMVSVNLTMVEGGKQVNVIPSELTAHFDVRIPPTVDFEAFEKQLAGWCFEAATESGGGPDSITYSFHHKGTIQTITDIEDESIAPFWLAMRGAIKRCSLRTRLTICCGSSDSRFLRHAGVPSLGFLPLTETAPNLHGNDECVSEAAFLKGIRVFSEILKDISHA